ncbi:hypothetical protein AMS68_006745 [Peltaster fructicola]|uniref:Uncharacterized protein n=1 Tax=Peltaster fructicola TaxID=286661 RepID=A0A6H0Y2Z8_9PEZI|nr:hypothetical protein AMS68_006745 [Peltaster fructicola]
MCIIQVRIYTMEDGKEQRVEQVQKCEKARRGLPCDEVTTTEIRAQVLEIKPPGSTRSSRSTSSDIIKVQDRHGRDREYRRLSSRREGKRPVRDRDDRLPSAISPVSPRAMHTEEVRPPAPSPPRPAGNHYHPLNTRCPRDDCPMTHVSFDVEERTPTSSTKYKHEARRQQPGSSKTVTIEVPRNPQPIVPILQSPRPGKKAFKPDHDRHDSAVGLPSNRNADRAGDLDAQLRAQDLEQQRRRLAQSESQRLRAEAHEQALLAQLELDRARARESARNDSRERQRQARLAAEAAYDNAQRLQQESQADAEHERRVQGEARDRERERRANQRPHSVEVRSPLRPALTAGSPISPRVNRTTIIHQTRPGAVTTPSQQQSPGNQIIQREQDRWEREQSGRPAIDDPLSDDPWRSDNVVREWANGEEAPRRGHRRQYHGSERR